MQRQYREKVSKARASALLLQLVDALFASPLISIPRARDLLEVSFTAADHNIQRLVQEGILREITGHSRNRIFLAPAILKAIEDPLD